MIKRKIDEFKNERYEEILYWQQLKDGDRRGLEGLYTKFSRELFRYGMAVESDRNLIKDCIQELFIDLWKYRKTLKYTDNVKVYLCKSLSNRIFRELHLEKRRREQNPLDIHESLYGLDRQQIWEEDNPLDEQKNRLRTALVNLPVRQRKIIQLVFFEKLSSEEVSEKMGIGVQSVYTLTWKAITRLKQSFLLIVLLF